MTLEVRDAETDSFAFLYKYRIIGTVLFGVFRGKMMYVKAILRCFPSSSMVLSVKTQPKTIWPKIRKPKRGDELEFFLSRMENPNHGVTVDDPQTGQGVVLRYRGDQTDREEERNTPHILSKNINLIERRKSEAF